MKLPKDPKRKIQILVFAGVLVLVGLRVFVGVVILPLLESQAAARKGIRELEQKLEEGRREAAKLKALRSRSERARQTLLEISSRHVLEAQFGNYEIKARETLERLAGASGVKLDAASPVGETSLPPRPGGRAKNVTHTYILRAVGTLSGENGYAAMTNFFLAIANHNPYASVSAVSIAAQPEFVQTFNFNVAWPVWEDRAMGTNLALRASPGGRPSPAPESGRKERRT